MNVKVTVSCPDCSILHGLQPFELQSNALHLTLFSTGEGNYYTFFCPQCYAEVNKPADEIVCGLLLGYVSTTLVQVPAEVLDRQGGPPLGSDDLMNFLIELYADDWRVTDQIYFDSAKRARA